jgi:hypothetical protein
MSQTVKYGRGLLLSFAAGLLLLLPAGPAQAATEPRFDVFVGYNNILPDQGWFPITCEVQNDGPSFDAVIEVSTEQVGRSQTRRMKLDLPTGTLKRVVIPVFTAANVWKVRLLDGRGRVRAERTTLPATVISHELPLVAALCRTVPGLPSFPDLPNSSRFSTTRYGAARLQAETFPDNPLAMESIDLLYLNSAKALELKDPQVVALRAWLQNGGHLVIGVEQVSDITGNTWLPALMPCDLTDVRVLNSHPQLQQWLHGLWSSTRVQEQILPDGAFPGGNVFPGGGRRASSGGPGVQFTPPGMLPGGTRTSDVLPNLAEDDNFEAAPLPVVTGTMRDGAILIGDDAAPLAVTAPRGRGRITVLTFSPEREPFLSWTNKAWFWAKLSEIPLSRLTSGDNSPFSARQSSDGIFGSMIDSKQIRKLPLPWLLVLLAAYLAVIGPLDQYFLKKIKRQMLTWITFPVYVAAFSGLIYWIGYHLRAGELEWNELNVVDVLPDLGPGAPSPVLRGESYLSIYSPVNADYELQGAPGFAFATLRGEYGGNFGGGSETTGAAIVQTGNGFFAEAHVPVWTSQLYVSDWLQHAEPVPLAMTATRQGNGWNATIENKTDHDLPQARLVVGQRIYDLPMLPKGKNTTFLAQPTAGTPLANFVNQYGNAFQNAVQTRRSNFGSNGRFINVPDGVMAVSFLGRMNAAGEWSSFAVFRGLDLSRYAGSDHAILLAWDPGHSPVASLNNFTAKRTHSDSLLRLVVSVK